MANKALGDVFLKSSILDHRRDSRGDRVDEVLLGDAVHSKMPALTYLRTSSATNVGHAAPFLKG